MQSIPALPRVLARIGVIALAAILGACDLQAPTITAPEALTNLTDATAGAPSRGSRTRPSYVVGPRLDYATSVFTTAAAGDAFVGFFRYPAEERQWMAMQGDSAFYRDAFVSGDTEHEGAVDGDTWYAKALGPNGLQVQWSNITFRSTYNGEQDCFVSSGWYLCGGDYIYVQWYLGSQCLPPGEYTMQFFKNGQMFEERKYTLKPSIPADKVTLYSQLGNNEHYSNYCSLSTNTSDRHLCDGRANEVKLTIHRLGCAMTSAAMMLSYHGVDVTPTALNAWLKTNGGYSRASLIFAEVARYARQAAGVNVTYVGPAGGPDAAGLQRAICQYGPVPTNVYGSSGSPTGHWVLSWGRDNPLSTFKIYDPAGGVERTLQFTRYRNTNSGRRVFAGPERTYTDPYSGMNFFFHSPGELLVSDAAGRRTGYDPSTGTTYREIPGAVYDSSSITDPEDETEVPHVTREFEFMRAPAGEYTVTVTGTGTGTYSLDMRTWSRAGDRGATEFADVPISPGVVHTFVVKYDPASAAPTIPIGGGFAGGGQAATVDAFLTYSSPTERQIDLPAGTTAYPLFIFYGATIDPATFSAELNGVSVTHLFNPQRGGMDAVSLPVQPGRNLLLVRVGGLKGTRTSRDTDRLVLKVP